MHNQIKIYGFPLSGHSHRVELFANIAGLNHQMIIVDLAAGEHKQAEFLSLNPVGQVPVMVDGDIVISDSNAILVYLARKYAPSFLPNDPVLEARVQKFLTLAAGEIAFGPAAARLITVFNAQLDVGYTHDVAARVLRKLETHMAGKTFLVDEQPTIADIAIYSYVAHAPEGNISLDEYPNVRRLLSNIESLEGFVSMPETKVGLRA
ncbi:glutathione S-transferase family protein [Aliiglaciecola sp. M165]|uniref:glutathione S-transferase family protein n=1 Tax=Aliiglaciecola sp. M165 TaxID=2593649 RepID=UPI00117FACDA|nr:glutathione S-transferase [Aliiglaciecola sp. M165]TRY28783.1 glutathione S-transferase [Aliiglaciecola sp. M165]